jgi:hypothetical protein
VPGTRIAVALPSRLAADAGGRLLVFAQPAASPAADPASVDLGAPDVSVTGRDVASFGPTHSATVDTQAVAHPQGFAALPPGDYRMQAVLDRDGDYNYAGRDADDLVSQVTTVHLPLTGVPAIALDHAVPPARDQFDITGLPPVAAAQIAASRPHLHDESVASPLLSGFNRSPRAIRAWVLTPPNYDPKARATYPTVYTAGAFGTNHRIDGQQLSRQWQLMETGAIPPMIWVTLDFASPSGTTEFADSASNGPWGEALVREVIPALERRYRMDARPSGRFLTGHSSGGWFALWTMVTHPAMFGGSWPSSPDPVDFRDFIGVDLYAPGANMYRDAGGSPRPLERDRSGVRQTIEQLAKLEVVLGHRGGQLGSFEWVFSPRRADGTPAPLFDRTTGAVDPAVAAHWRAHYDTGHRIETEWPRLRRHLDGKLHVTVGDADSYYLDGSVRRLEAAFRKVGGHADFTYVPGATHSMNEVYTRAGDRNAGWKEMTRAMLAIARPRCRSPDRRVRSAQPRSIVNFAIADQSRSPQPASTVSCMRAWTASSIGSDRCASPAASRARRRSFSPSVALKPGSYAPAAMLAE